MKILHITTVPMSLTFLKGQVRFMTARGFRVHAVSAPGPELDAFARSEGVSVSSIVMHRRITPVRDFWTIVQLLGLMLHERPAIVHAHTPKGGLLGMIAAWLYRAPVRIYHMRGLPLMGASGWRRVLLRTTERLACRLAHQVLCVSHSLRAEALAAGMCRPERIKVLLQGSGNGVDAKGRFRPDRNTRLHGLAVRQSLGIPPAALVIGFVGRIVPDKGILDLVAAWHSLRTRFATAHLLLVGPFEAETPLPASAMDTLLADPRVHLTGLEWDTVPLYSAMDVVALPSHREGFPNVLLEAAALQLPVVATRIPGCIDAVEDGTTGILVNPRDSAALCAALGMYLDNGERRRRDGCAARARVQREFQQERLWEAVQHEYQRLLSECRALGRQHDAVRT